MELRIAVSKIDKYGHADSGDTVEIIERPNGGLSVVMADGQIEGKNNKAISTMVTHRVINHISAGVRDSAAIRAAVSSIFTEFNGKVKANLNVISADLQTDTILISRNSPVPVFLISDDMVERLASASEPLGNRIESNPTIIELQIKRGLAVIAFSDGVFNAGSQDQQISDVVTTIDAFIDEQEPSAQEIADFLLQRAIRMDEGRPLDDMSVIVLSVSPQSIDQIRRMNVTMTLNE